MYRTARCLLTNARTKRPAIEVSAFLTLQGKRSSIASQLS